MTRETGLRERKKQQTRRTLADVATRLFAERGFDAVTVADIAAAAEVSAKTVFNYFPTKEELVLNGLQETETDLLRAVRERPAGASVLEAVRRHTLETAERMRAVPQERRAAFRKVLLGAPTVRARWRELMSRREDALAQVLKEETGASADDVTPRLIASLLGVVGRLAFSDVSPWPDGRRKSQGEVTEEIHRAFELLERGLAGYGVRAPEPPSAPSPGRHRRQRDST